MAPGMNDGATAIPACASLHPGYGMAVQRLLPGRSNAESGIEDDSALNRG